MTRLIAPPSRTTPGWSDADYATAGVSGREAARRFRRIWLAPDVAGALRDASFTVDQSEALAMTTATSTLAEAVATGWLTPETLLAFGYHQMHGAWDLRQWVRVGLDAADCWTLRHHYSDVQPDLLARYVEQASVPVRWLPDVLRRAQDEYGLPAPSVREWLHAAVRLKVGPLRNTGTWQFLGDRTGLYLAAGLTPEESVAREEALRLLPRSQRAEIMEALLSLARVRGHHVGTVDEWVNA